MTHPVDALFIRVIRRMRADANMALTEARKRESNGSGWEQRHAAEHRLERITECLEAVETMPDE